MGDLITKKKIPIFNSGKTTTILNAKNSGLKKSTIKCFCLEYFPKKLKK